MSRQLLCRLSMTVICSGIAAIVFKLLSGYPSAATRGKERKAGLILAPNCASTARVAARACSADTKLVTRATMRVGVSGIGELQPGCAVADRAEAGAAALGATAELWTAGEPCGDGDLPGLACAFACRSGTVFTVAGSAPAAVARPPAGAPDAPRSCTTRRGGPMWQVVW